MNKSALLLEKFKKLPFGLWLFSKVVCLKAPYFASIKPVFISLKPGEGKAYFKKRRSVSNHLGTVHAIAIANLCELVAGTTLEITLPNTHRWIPKSMKIDYLAKAKSGVTASTKIDSQHFPQESGTILVPIEVFDSENTKVTFAEVTMYISRRS